MTRNRNQNRKGLPAKQSIVDYWANKFDNKLSDESFLLKHCWAYGRHLAYSCFLSAGWKMEECRWFSDELAICRTERGNKNEKNDLGISVQYHLQ